MLSPATATVALHGSAVALLQEEGPWMCVPLALRSHRPKMAQVAETDGSVSLARQDEFVT